jgi:type VI secretion system secreted protein VgrG
MGGKSSRLTEMSIDLGDDQIVLERIECLEALSSPFTVIVDIISPLEIDLQPHLGKPCSVSVSEDDVLLRHFHGLIVSGEYSEESNSGHHYRLTLKPWSYFLSQNRDMAIFQRKTAVDIIKRILEAASISDIDYSRLTKTRTERIYCVQYRESDFAFISRLMEEEGIYYYYRHDKDRHVMVLCEGPSGHASGTPAKLEYNPNSVSVFSADSVERSSRGKNFLQSWIERVSTNAEAKVTIRDFDFKSPAHPLAANKSAEANHPNDNREVYLYPGRIHHDEKEAPAENKAGQERSENMLDGLRANRRVFTGTSQSAGLSCGCKVEIGNHPAERMNDSYMITSTYHSIAAESYRSGQGDSELEFNVRFEAIPADIRYQAPITTPRPIIHGLESAIVTGPHGEEIFTDKYGRVKVRFHWDRGTTQNENSTCWIRVSQTGGLGNLILPRVGHEVLVDFLDGDPDRPLIVGRVFNEANMPIYPLPDNKTRALWRTKRYGEAGSYPETKALDSGEPGANEIRFEDKGGSEEIYLHAERDMNTRIRFKETHHVGNDQTLMIGHDRSEEVVHDEKVKIGHDRNAEVINDEKLKVGGEQNVEVVKNRTTKVDLADKLTVGTSYTLDAGTTITEKANTSIELKVAGSSIKIDPMGITIKAPTISIEGQISVDVKSPITTVKADALLTLKGALTLIN